LAIFVFCCRDTGELIFDLRFESFQSGHAHEVELDGFKHPFIGTLADAPLQQQRTNEGQIDLDGYALRRFGQPMTVAQDALDPSEKSSTCQRLR